MIRLAIRPLQMVPFVLVVALSSNAYSSDLFESRCRSGFSALAEKLKICLGLAGNCSEDSSAVSVFATLQTRNLFLEQDAAYLRNNTCGGTCSSVSMINNMLVMRETLHPGSITNLTVTEVQALHQRLMDEILTALSNEKGVDGTKGAHLSNFKEIVPKVFQKVFGGELNEDVSLRSLGAVGFQSISPGDSSLLVLSVSSGKSSHAIVVTAVTAADRTRRNKIVPEEFIATISDPHAPRGFKELKVYERNSVFYLEGYGDGKPVEIEVHGQTFRVTAGIINDSVAINFRRRAETKIWTDADISGLLDRNLPAKKANIFLRDGTVLQNVTLVPTPNPGKVHFFHRFMLKGNIPLEQIADIQPAQSSNAK